MSEVVEWSRYSFWQFSVDIRCWKSLERRSDAGRRPKNSVKTGMLPISLCIGIISIIDSTMILRLRMVEDMRREDLEAQMGEILSRDLLSSTF
jgi:hypothetical protein